MMMTTLVRIESAIEILASEGKHRCCSANLYLFVTSKPWTKWKIGKITARTKDFKRYNVCVWVLYRARTVVLRNVQMSSTHPHAVNVCIPSLLWEKSNAKEKKKKKIWSEIAKQMQSFRNWCNLSYLHLVGCFFYDANSRCEVSQN